MGEAPDLCLYQENSLFPHRNLVTAFQTRFTAQWPYARWRGCGGSSVPISSRHIIWGFFYEKCSQRFLQETNKAHAPAMLWGEELWYHFPAKRVSQAAPHERCPWPAHGQKHIYTSLVCTFWRWNLPCLHENHAGHVGPLSCPNPGNSLFLFSFEATCL